MTHTTDTLVPGSSVHTASLARLSHAKTRSITAENPTGAPGKGGMATEGAAAHVSRGLGPGWKVSPCIYIESGETREIAVIEGPAAIQHIWITMMDGRWRHTILRIYWDDQDWPSVECPLGDFFANGWERFAQVSSLTVCTNPARGFNCFWEMPFRKRARITINNVSEEKILFFYQVTYALGDVSDDLAYFHAQFRRTNPVPWKEVHTIVDGVEGHGHYVGTYMAWGVNSGGWWGEGEVKFYLDDDDEYPTICGTGTEDYFGGAFNFDLSIHDKTAARAYASFTGPHMGMPQVICPDGLYRSQQRFGLYRWHIVDPIRFTQRLKVTVQDLGTNTDKDLRFVPRQDDVASVAFWYQTLPSAKFPSLPGPDRLEVI